MKKIIHELLPYVVILVIVVLMRTYVITPVQVVGKSMDDTLNNGQTLLLNKARYRFTDIERFDIVVINEDNGDKIIKRIIGLPGETIKYKDNKLYINGEEVEDKFNNGKTRDFEYSGVIPEDKYFVLGDNRDISSDSRIIGLVDKSQIQGRTRIRIWPLNKIEIVK